MHNNIQGATPDNMTVYFNTSLLSSAGSDMRENSYWR